MRRPDQISPDHAGILATLARSYPVPPSSVQPGTVVRVTGEARPGPGGLLVAPLSGRACVWFRVLEWRFPPVLPFGGGLTTHPVIASIVTSDMGLGVPGATSIESPAPFAVADGTGELVIDPRGADVDAPLVTVDDTQGDYGLSTYVLRREWVLLAGAPVFALGPAFDDGGQPVLRAGSVDGLVVSGRGEQAAVHRSSSFVAAAGGTPLGGLRLPSPLVIVVVVAVTGVLLAVVGALIVA